MRKRWLIVLSLLVVILILGPRHPARARNDGTPALDPGTPCEPPGPCKSSDGEWFMLESEKPSEVVDVETTETTGGPDAFGYTWDDSVALNWIDATAGTDTGMSGGSGQATGPIDLPFPFKYYENTYSEVYITSSGYLAFDNKGLGNIQGSMPSPADPNNVIAPYWTDFDLASSGSSGRVFYDSGGISPNRYFVVQWNEVTDEVAGEVEGPHTFEVILHENGDIVFQYGEMNYLSIGYSCASAGIEDSRGLDGLTYVDYCGRIWSDHKAVRFYRPESSARVVVYPQYEGRFVRAAETVEFPLLVRNTGELGADTYAITAYSNWSLDLYAADGVTPLTDSDGDGTVDTGSIAQGESLTVIASVTAPNAVNVGDANQANLFFSSSVDPMKYEVASLHTTVPAPFAQAFRDADDGAVSLYLVQPDQQRTKRGAADVKNYNDIAIAEMPDGFVYVRNYYRWTDDVGKVELEYTLLDENGDTLRDVAKLTDHSGATVATYDYDPAVAVTPNGYIGILWYRYRFDYNDLTTNDNIYFAILDDNGNLIYGPSNLTHNEAWGDWGDEGVPSFDHPQIAATDDNRFVLAWERDSLESGGSLTNIYYTVRGTNGGVVKSNTQFTDGLAGGQTYETPTLTRLSGNKVLLAYDCSVISYAVLDSQGNTVKEETPTGGRYGRTPDAVELSNGHVLLAWTRVLPQGGEAYYTVLDGTTYSVVVPPAALNNPAGRTGDDYVSVTADAGGHGILTWTDYDSSYRQSLYYALVGSSGNVITEPAIFYTSQAMDPHVETSYTGYGNTSYSLVTPSSDDVDMRVEVPSLIGGPAEGETLISVQVGNRGLSKATSVVFTATLDADLGPVSMSSTLADSGDTTVTWDVGDLDFLGYGQIVLRTTVPSATLGTRYPITWTVTSDGPEADANDNIVPTEIMVARQVFLPLVARGY